MKISRRSWHYRLHVFIFTCWNLENYGPIRYIEGQRYEHEPKSLCGYFWSTVSLLALMIVFAPIFIVVMVLLWVGYYTVQAIKWPKRQYRRKHPAPEKPPKPKKEPGILRLYLKARKEKVCPMIELED